MNADDPNVRAEIPEELLVLLKARYQEVTARMRVDLAEDLKEYQATTDKWNRVRDLARPK